MMKSMQHRIKKWKQQIKINWCNMALWPVCVLLALMWATAGFGKLRDLEDFRFELGKSPLLEGFEGIVSWAVPWGELLLAVVLIFPTSRLFGLYSSVFLLSLFIAYIIALLWFSYYDAPCACSGFAEGLSWEGHIIFNSVCLVMAIAGVFIKSIPVRATSTVPDIVQSGMVAP
ncbi:hypothetical protein H8S90_10525 [Olivibacter sp. SDN3]|uniref:MauE/DoxX family redox-associated membrane protein n=1 Tax=Olivibacter sp. SDN3 TaxID=2764720 RepID=UPI001650E595|nr:MauE/DoxX family redox-associated membrane protein [Olivibacter sp. SDN3]QNL51968.1 hypothetical protein H8S90_10525 [Olivibacter sp. SDN3]